jgi:hypothetical protein
VATNAPPAAATLPRPAPPQATVWIAVFSYIGNYFWTHYFFKLLGAAYTMPSPKLNDVRCLAVPAQCPVPSAFELCLCTHAPVA